MEKNDFQKYICAGLTSHLFSLIWLGKQFSPGMLDLRAADHPNHIPANQCTKLQIKNLENTQPEVNLKIL